MTADLKDRLVTWANQYDEAQRRPGQGPSNFKSIKVAEEFVAEGERLRQDLQKQLGPAWNVEYMPTARAFP